MRVLSGEANIVSCSKPRLNGRRLIARVSTPIPVDACIAIDCEDTLLLGEAVGAYRDGSLIFAVIELNEAAINLRTYRRCLDDGVDDLSRQLSA